MSFTINKKIRFFIFLFCLLFSFLCVFIVLGYRAASIPLSYLPKVPGSFLHGTDVSGHPVEIKNQNYILIADVTGNLTIKSPQGKVIVSGLTYFSDLRWGLQDNLAEKLNDSVIQIQGRDGNKAIVTLLLITHDHSPAIDVKIKTDYKSTAVVQREALVLKFSVPISEVYLKNRKTDTLNFESEYWLRQEGVRFGTSETSALIYHTPFVSSLQLETAKKLLFVNLDYYLDHPHIKMNYGKDTSQNWTDLSASGYTKGSVKYNSFTLNIGDIPRVTARLMPVPYGFEAGYVFTEHADGANIKNQRAVYFGSEDIINWRDATGGFIGHKIPVTKSVFYSGTGDTLGEAIKEKYHDTLLVSFLDQLYQTGLYDICLHTPENFNSTREVLKEAMHYMKERYHSPSWIDHGFYDGENREAFAADGLDSTSTYYAGDLWAKYDVRYFWSPAVELIEERSRISVTDQLKRFHFYNAYVSLLRHYISARDLKKFNYLQAFKVLSKRYSYKRGLHTLESYLSNSIPTPIYWQHPTRTKQFYSWSTSFVYENNDFSTRGVEQEKTQLEDLIDNRGVLINHEYSVRDIGSKNIINRVDGKLLINPYFDKILGIMADKSDQGELYITTIKDLLDYWISLTHISFEYLPGGEIQVNNNNNSPVKGLSIILNTENVFVDGHIPLMKHLGQEKIIWFDMAANSKVKLVAAGGK